MKRIITLLFAAMLTGQAWAQTTFEVGNQNYTVTDETKHYVSAVANSSVNPTGTIVIPEKVINPSTSVEYTVTSIGDEVFRFGFGLTSVTIPNSVTSIGYWAFRGCTGLKEINVESANTKYASKDGVLFNKDKTTIICYPAGKTGTTYTIPNSVTSIDHHAFRDCRSLTSITIPTSVTSIGANSFFHCKSLTSVTIPNSVTTINVGAFLDCPKLTSVFIPSSVTSISEGAFGACHNATLYCEVDESSKPDGWHSAWNSSNIPVKWGCKADNRT